MAVPARFGLAQEVYSIDECWLDVSHVPDAALEAYGREIWWRVYYDVSLMVSVGIATTKVRSKIAAELAKRHGIFQGGVSLLSWSKQDVDGWLRGIAVEDVWGIGKRLGNDCARSGL